MKNPTHVLFHANCNDGFGAAFAVWRKFGDSITYIPCSYGTPPPQLPTEARVLIVDFSFSKPVALALAQKVYEIKLLDHHQSAANDLKDVPWCDFDMSHSGAYLAWEYIHENEPPEFIKYVEDRDLWAFKLPSSKEFSAALSSYPRNFVVWEGLAEMGMDKLKLEGGPILRAQGQMVDNIIANTAFWKDIGGHRVPVANTSVFCSEVGDRLCQIHPTAPFAAYFFDDGSKRHWGLRSPGRMNVFEIAKKFGGGGHPGAAGYLEPAPQRIEER